MERMALNDFRKLSKRDFDNGAVLDEIENGLRCGAADSARLDKLERLLLGATDDSITLRIYEDPDIIVISSGHDDLVAGASLREAIDDVKEDEKNGSLLSTGM